MLKKQRERERENKRGWGDQWYTYPIQLHCVQGWGGVHWWVIDIWYFCPLVTSKINPAATYKHTKTYSPTGTKCLYFCVNGATFAQIYSLNPHLNLSKRVVIADLTQFYVLYIFTVISRSDWWWLAVKCSFNQIQFHCMFTLSCCTIVTPTGGTTALCKIGLIFTTDQRKCRFSL